MNCPTCRTTMRSIAYEGVTIQTCNGCGGEFVGPKELCSIVKTRQTVFGPHLKQLLQQHEPMFGTPADAVERHLTCPACQGVMQLVNYSGDTGVAIDRCDSCGGIWLDHEELEKVQLIIETWQDRAPGQLMEIADQLEHARYKAAQACGAKFAGSRFSFVNALINRLLDAA